MGMHLGIAVDKVRQERLRKESAQKAEKGREQQLIARLRREVQNRDEDGEPRRR